MTEEQTTESSPTIMTEGSPESAVLEANAAFYRAFEKKDLEAMAQVWSQGTSSTCIHPGRDLLRGWDSIRESWQGIFDQFTYLVIETELVWVECHSALACLVIKESVLQVNAGRRIMKGQSIATNVFERMSQRWYLIHHHASVIDRKSR